MKICYTSATEGSFYYTPKFGQQLSCFFKLLDNDIELTEVEISTQETPVSSVLHELISPDENLYFAIKHNLENAIAFHEKGIR